MSSLIKARYYSRYEIEEHQMEQMFALFQEYYDNASYSTFINDLNKKSGAFILMQRNNDKIVGFTTVLKMNMKLDNQKIVGIFSGDTIVSQNYWGNTANLQFSLFVYFLKQKLIHPFRPVYWLLISKGYKTYLLLANNFVNYHPCYYKQNQKLARITRTYAHKLFPENFDPELGILVFDKESQRLKQNVAEITEEMCRKEPKIKFFSEKNPKWMEGTELCCIGAFDLPTFLSYPFKYLKKIFNNNFIKDSIQNHAFVLHTKSANNKRDI